MRRDILRRKSRHKNTTVFIEEDFSQRTREIRRNMFEVAKREWAKGKTAFVRSDKIDIGCQRFRWNTESKELELEAKLWSKKRERQGRRQEVNLISWNVVEVKSNDSNFWNFVKGFKVIIFLETWLEDKDWNGWKGRLPTEYTWERVNAQQIKQKGRAAGGILMGIKK